MEKRDPPEPLPLLVVVGDGRRNSPAVERDEAAGRARTKGGRVYELGYRTAVNDLDEGVRTALRLLVAQFLGTEPLPGDIGDARWVAARKMARHPGLEASPRDRDAVERLLSDHEEHYLALRAGRRPHWRPDPAVPARVRSPPDAPAFDHAWFDRLFIAGGVRMRVRLLDM